MSRTAVTIEWIIVYSVTSLLMGGLLMSMLGDEAHRPKWVDGAIFLVILGGLGLIIWQGTQGHLPGTGMSTRGFFPFVTRFIAWSGGLAILVGVLGALTGYVYDRVFEHTTNRDFATAMILFPGMAGGALGAVVGAVISIVKALR